MKWLKEKVFALKWSNKKAFNPLKQIKGSIIHNLYFIVAGQVVLLLVAVVAVVRCALRRNRCIACRTMRQAIQYSLFSFSW